MDIVLGWEGRGEGKDWFKHFRVKTFIFKRSDMNVYGKRKCCFQSSLKFIAENLWFFRRKVGGIFNILVETGNLKWKGKIQIKRKKQESWEKISDTKVASLHLFQNERINWNWKKYILNYFLPPITNISMKKLRFYKTYKNLWPDFWCWYKISDHKAIKIHESELILFLNNFSNNLFDLANKKN